MSRARRGQSTMEMAVITAVVGAALVGMQIYLKRSINGRLRKAADEIGEQYAPRRTDARTLTAMTGTTRTTSTMIDDDTEFNTLRTVTRIGVDGNPERVIRTGTEVVGPYQNSLWDR